MEEVGAADNDGKEEEEQEEEEAAEGNEGTIDAEEEAIDIETVGTEAQQDAEGMDEIAAGAEIADGMEAGWTG